jgi:hypothetical protein
MKHNTAEELYPLNCQDEVKLFRWPIHLSLAPGMGLLTGNTKPAPTLALTTRGLMVHVPSENHWNVSVSYKIAKW